MLLTEVWELLEHFAGHPPMHRLMQYVAPTFGYKPPQTKDKTGRPASFHDAARANAAVDLGQFKARREKVAELPAHLRESPNWQKIIERAKNGGN